MEFAVCAVPSAPVRKKPSHKKEMINQLLFGEEMVVLKEKGKWLQVQSVHDNYEGWIRNNLVAREEQPARANSFVATDLFNTITIAGVRMHIPFGSTLPGLNKGRGQLSQTAYEFKGSSLNRYEVRPTGEIIEQFTVRWLNAPYLWGGRTPLGVDCSGFVQVIFKMMGVDLLRDSEQQEGQGVKIKGLENAKCGDLAFFRNKRKEITHVGILLSGSKIIHASGKVRIDSIDKKGIIHADTGKQTHALAGIRRYW